MHVPCWLRQGDWARAGQVMAWREDPVPVGARCLEGWGSDPGGAILSRKPPGGSAVPVPAQSAFQGSASLW